MKLKLFIFLILFSLITNCSYFPTQLNPNLKEFDMFCRNLSYDKKIRYVEFEAVLDIIAHENYGFNYVSTFDEIPVKITGELTTYYHPSFQPGTAPNKLELIKPQNANQIYLDYRIKTDDGQYVTKGSKVTILAKMFHPGVPGRCNLIVEKVKTFVN